MFSLSENVANKMTKYGMMGDMIKHTRTHLVRTYPKGTRLSSTNYEPHRFWAGGMQLVAINWQTFGKKKSYLSLTLYKIYFLGRSGLYDQSRHVPT